MPVSDGSDVPMSCSAKGISGSKGGDSEGSLSLLVVLMLLRRRSSVVNMPEAAAGAPADAVSAMTGRYDTTGVVGFREQLRRGALAITRTSITVPVPLPSFGPCARAFIYAVGFPQQRRKNSNQHGTNSKFHNALMGRCRSSEIGHAAPKGKKCTLRTD